jgi:hypothetical protein
MMPHSTPLFKLLILGVATLSEQRWSTLGERRRPAKAQSRTADMHAMEESDCRVVPVKQPNKEGKPLAEAVEGDQPDILYQFDREYNEGNGAGWGRGARAGV